jgi:hypothetical protein
MMTIENFIQEHSKICLRKNGGKIACAKSIYNYLLKHRPERIEKYNKVDKNTRAELIICSK